MSKCRLLVLILFFPVFISQAQNEDALKPMIISENEATGTKHGEEIPTHLNLEEYDILKHKINESLESIWAYIEEGNPKAIQVANEIMALSKQHKYILGEAQSLEYKGLYHEIVKGDVEKASQYYFEALELCKVNKLDYLPEILQTIGLMFHTIDNYEKAKDYYEKALAQAHENDNKDLQKRSLINLGSVHSSLGNYGIAEDFFVESLHIMESTHHDFDVYANMGNMLMRQNEYVKALPYLKKAIKQHPNNTESENNLRFIIDVKSKLADTTEMKHILKRAEQAIDVWRNARDQSLLLNSLSTYYQSIGKFEKALEYKNKYLEVYSEIIENKKNELVFNLEAKYQNEVAAKTIEAQNLKLEQESTKRKRYLTIGISASILLLASSGFLYILWIKKKKLKHAIKLKINALDENKLLLNELHHRTKNNLQLLNALLSIQGSHAENAEVVFAIESIQESVEAINLLHHHLYQNKNYKMVSLEPYILDLCTYFKNAFGLEQRNIQLTHECETIYLETDQAIALGLIINELVTNSIKHAFEKFEKKGYIHIQISKKEKVVIAMTEDNGIGISEKNYNQKFKGQKLMDIFINHYKADFKCNSGKNGTKSIFYLYT